MQTEFQEVKATNLSMIDQFGEISKEFDFDKNTSVLENIKQLGTNISSYDDKIEVLNQEKMKIVARVTSCLENAGVDLDDVPEDSLDTLLEKLDELLLNYREDSRQMSSLNSMNQNLTSDNQKLKDANYDLRYELQELNIELEKVQAELKKGGVKEQRAQMFDEVVSDTLQGPTMVAQNVMSQVAKNDAYADLSINKEPPAMAFPTAESDEQKPVAKKQVAEKPAPQKSSEPKKKAAPQKPAPPKPQEQASGYLASIASFFLTETELQGQNQSARKQGEESEYEYYEEEYSEDEPN